MFQSVYACHEVAIAFVIGVIFVIFQFFWYVTYVKKLIWTEEMNYLRKEIKTIYILKLHVLYEGKVLNQSGCFEV